MIRKPLAVCQRVTRTVVIPAVFCRRKIILGRRYYLKMTKKESRIGPPPFQNNYLHFWRTKCKQKGQ